MYSIILKKDCRCKNVESAWIENPPLNEVLPLFIKWKEQITYCARGLKVGILQFQFQDEETAYVVSIFFIETKTYIFYPISMGKQNCRDGIWWPSS